MCDSSAERPCFLYATLPHKVLAFCGRSPQDSATLAREHQRALDLLNGRCPWIANSA